MSYMLDDIVQMETDPSSNLVNLTTVLKDQKKVISFELANSYEKYLFKTIVYNHLVFYKFNPRSTT